jgi:hypothetical protein
MQADVAGPLKRVLLFFRGTSHRRLIGSDLVIFGTVLGHISEALTYLAAPGAYRGVPLYATLLIARMHVLWCAVTLAAAAATLAGMSRLPLRWWQRPLCFLPQAFLLLFAALVMVWTILDADALAACPYASPVILYDLQLWRLWMPIFFLAAVWARLSPEPS